MRPIDADKVLETMRSNMDMQELYLPTHFIDLVIDNMPTVEAEPVNDNCSSEPKGEIAKIKILLDREEVFEAVERITNEAIEKGLRKSTIQKSLILEIGSLKPAKIEYEYDNYDPSGVGQAFSP